MIYALSITITVYSRVTWHWQSIFFKKRLEFMFPSQDRVFKELKSSENRLVEKHLSQFLLTDYPLMTEKRVQKVCHILPHLELGEGYIYCSFSCLCFRWHALLVHWITCCTSLTSIWPFVPRWWILFAQYVAHTSRPCLFPTRQTSIAASDLS